MTLHRQSELFPLNVVLICGDEPSALLIRRALARLSVFVENQFPDVGAAIAGLPPAEERRLFVVHVDSPEAADAPRRLTADYPACPILAVVPDDASKELIMNVLRAGALQIIPLNGNERDLESALNCLSIRFTDGIRASRLISVVGAHGGVGATTLALNLAAEVARRHQHRAIVTELTPSLGELATLLAMKPRYHLRQLFQRPERFDLYLVRESLERVIDGMQVLPGDPESFASLPRDADELVRFLSCLRRLTEVVVVDVSPELGATCYNTVSMANDVVLVTDQSVTSLHNLQLLLARLADEFAVKNVTVVVNRYNARLRALSAQKLQSLVSPVRTFFVPEDPEVGTAALLGRVLASHSTHAPALAAIDEVVDHLLQVQPTKTNGWMHWFMQGSATT